MGSLQRRPSWKPPEHSVIWTKSVIEGDGEGRAERPSTRTIYCPKETKQGYGDSRHPCEEYTRLQNLEFADSAVSKGSCSMHFSATVSKEEKGTDGRTQRKPRWRTPRQRSLTCGTGRSQSGKECRPLCLKLSEGKLSEGENLRSLTSSRLQTP